MRTDAPYPVSLWNHYDNVDWPRTNNNVEGYNAKLNKHCGAADPNIYKSISIFQTEEVNSYDKFVKANAGARAPYRRKLDIDRDNTLKRLIGMLKSNYLTFENYVKRRY